MKNVAAFFGGAGLGTLLGLLIGMSTSGMVGPLIGSITSILLVLLGLKENSDAIHKALRIGAFGFFCAGFALWGVHLRVNNAFSPTVSEDIAAWTADGNYSKETAAQFVAYQRLGVLPKDFEIDSLGAERADRRNSILHGKTASQSQCDKLRGYVDQDFEELISSWKRLSGDLKTIAEDVEAQFKSQPEAGRKTLEIIRTCLCDD